MVTPDAGTLRVLGGSPGSSHTQVGAVLDGTYLVPDWTVRQACAAVAPFYPGWDNGYALDLLEGFGLSATARVKELSRGETSKLHLTIALAHRPRLLILDEPTSGLDPLAREQVLGMLREFMVDPAHSVIFSTHITADLASIADRILILQHGHSAHAGAMDERTDTYFSVRGTVDDLPAEPSPLIGIRRTTTNFVAVVRADQTAGLPASVLIEAASVDEIVAAFAASHEGELAHV